MKQTRQIVIAFLIPFALAAGLFFLGDYIFPAECAFREIHHGEIVCFEYHDESEIERIYGLLILGLFLISLILPPFITGRNYQKKKAELKAKSIFR